MQIQGKLFRDFIIKKGLNDTEAGRMLGVSSEQISNYYKSKVFQKQTLYRIQSAFPDFSINDFDTPITNQKDVKDQIIENLLLQIADLRSKLAECESGKIRS